MTLPSSPYKGLIPYSEEDAPFFFGREAEQEIITANLMASRLTVLYGASGVGKSSVLRAGIAHHLRELTARDMAERGAPEFAVVVFNSWRDDPVVLLEERIYETLAYLPVREGQVEFRYDETSRIGLPEFLRAWTKRVDCDVLVILDQFEEYFLYHAQEDGEGTFAVEFPRAVNRPDLRASFLISIREDSLAKLDRFKGRIPNMFDNYLRVEHLDREAARAAAVKPIEQYNRLRAQDGQPVRLEPALVEAVLDQVRIGQVVLGETGRGVVGSAVAQASMEERIETPYLQLVMARLWDEEMKAGSPVLRRETLDRLGGAERIVRTHLDAAMEALPGEEQEAAARVFHFLVTPSGTKIAHTVPDLAEYAQLPEAKLATVLEKLSGASVRILRPVVPPPDRPTDLRYEIFHDVLAAAILDWRRRYVERQIQERIRREEEAQREQARADAARLERARQARVRNIVLAVLLPLIGGLVTLDWQKHSEAEEVRIELIRDRRAAVVQSEETEEARQAAARAVEQAEYAVGVIAQAANSNPRLVQSIDAAKLPPRLYLHIQDDQQRAGARRLTVRLKERGVVVLGIQKVDRGPRANEVRFFRESDREGADEIVELLQKLGMKDVAAKRIGGYEDSPKAKLRQYELWIAPDAPLEAQEEAEVDVILTWVDPEKKLLASKLIEGMTRWGEKESNAIVESLPQPIKRGVSRAEAERIKKMLTDIGARVEIKPTVKAYEQRR